MTYGFFFLVPVGALLGTVITAAALGRNYLSGLYAKLGANDRATGALAAREAMNPD